MARVIITNNLVEVTGEMIKKTREMLTVQNKLRYSTEKFKRAYHAMNVRARKARRKKKR